MKLEADWNVAR